MPVLATCLALCRPNIINHSCHLISQRSFRTSTCLLKLKKKQPESFKCVICGRKFKDLNVLNFHLANHHSSSLSQKLKENPVGTYSQIFGTQFQQNLESGTIQFGNGIVVHLDGLNKGKWQDLASDDDLKDPIQAIQFQHGFKLTQALEFAMNLSGLSPEKLKQFEEETWNDENKKIANTRGQKKVMETEQNVKTAKAIWNASTDIKGTLAEIYLNKHRGIPMEVLDRLQFGFLPDQSIYHDYIQGDLAAFPALVVKAVDLEGEVTGIQRIFLGSDGNKAQSVPYSKKVKGVVKGSIGLVQVGTVSRGGTVFVVEGAETGAAIASAAGSEVTILATLSVSLLRSAVPSVMSYLPRKVVLAIDYDASEVAQIDAMLAHPVFKKFMEKRGIEYQLAIPYLPDKEEEQGDTRLSSSSEEEHQRLENDSELKLSELLSGHQSGIGEFLQSREKGENVDWNDVLLKHGLDELRRQLDIS